MGEPITFGKLVLHWITLLALFGAALTGLVESKKRETVCGRVVILSPQSVELDSLWVVFAAGMSAEDFFDGLRRIETPQGVEFRKGSRLVRHFPSPLSIKLLIGGRKTPEEPSDELFADLDKDFMASLKFEAHWKTRTHMRPVDKIIVGGSSMERNKIWTYELTVESNNTPLTDHLIISVLNKNGARLARLAARL